MNEYYRQFLKYCEILQKASSNNYQYDEFLDAIREVMIDNNEKDKHAIVILGYSGNGKTTLISEYVKCHPEYKIVSMDSVARKVKSGSFFDIVKSFGEELEACYRNSDNVIIDGNFLNILTRSSLLDTLKIYSYQVDLVDLTKHINETIGNRIKDVACKRLGLTEEEYYQKKDDSSVILIKEEIYNFFENEKKRNSFDIQNDYCVVTLGANNYYDRDEIDKVQFKGNVK